MGWAIMANRLRLIIQFSPLEKKLFLWELINRRQIYLKSFLLKMKLPNDRHQGCRRCQWWAFQENTHKHRCVKRKSFGSWTWASRQLYSTNQMPCSKYITLVINQYWNVLENYRMMFLFFVLCCPFLARTLKFLNYSPQTFFVLFFISGRFY